MKDTLPLFRRHEHAFDPLWQLAILCISVKLLGQCLLLYIQDTSFRSRCQDLKFLPCFCFGFDPKLGQDNLQPLNIYYLANVNFIIRNHYCRGVLSRTIIRNQECYQQGAPVRYVPVRPVRCNLQGRLNTNTEGVQLPMDGCL